jgi:hypothetical protein
MARPPPGPTGPRHLADDALFGVACLADTPAEACRLLSSCSRLRGLAPLAVAEQLLGRMRTVPAAALVRALDLGPGHDVEQACRILVRDRGAPLTAVATMLAVRTGYWRCVGLTDDRHGGRRADALFLACAMQQDELLDALLLEGGGPGGGGSVGGGPGGAEPGGEDEDHENRDPQWYRWLQEVLVDIGMRSPSTIRVLLRHRAPVSVHQFGRLVRYHRDWELLHAAVLLLSPSRQDASDALMADVLVDTVAVDAVLFADMLLVDTIAADQPQPQPQPQPDHPHQPHPHQPQPPLDPVATLAPALLAWMRGARGADAVQHILDDRVLAAVTRREDLLALRLLALGARMTVDAFMERLCAIPEALADAVAVRLRPVWGAEAWPPTLRSLTHASHLGWLVRQGSRMTVSVFMHYLHVLPEEDADAVLAASSPGWQQEQEEQEQEEQMQEGIWAGRWPPTLGYFVLYPPSTVRWLVRHGATVPLMELIRKGCTDLAMDALRSRTLSDADWQDMRLRLFVMVHRRDQAEESGYRPSDLEAARLLLEAGIRPFPDAAGRPVRRFYLAGALTGAALAFSTLALGTARR